MAEPVRHQIRFGGRTFENDYVFPAEIAALRAHRTGQFQEKVILEWLQKRKLEGVYVDAGAHIGNHSLFFAAFCPSTEIISIEAHPTIYKLLVGNMRRNLKKDELGKMHMQNFAAWGRPGTKVRMATIPRNNAGHTCVVQGPHSGLRPEIEVATTTIDEEVKKIATNDPVAVLKIDVEDCEEQVLMGSMNTINRHKPVIIIERHTDDQLRAALRILKPFRYDVTANWKGVHTFALESK